MKPLGEKLPILISVPHGGMKIPEDFQTKCLIDPSGILMDGDTWSRLLFDFRGLVEEYVATDIARLVVDMNRSPNDLPPSNPDGVVKTFTVDRKQVWDDPSGLSVQEIKHLLERYHKPYHQALRAASKNKKVVLGIDCHTMLDISPSSVSLRERKRPLFCIGNRGSEMGHQLNEPITAPTQLILKLQESLNKQFKTLVPKNTQQPWITLNSPFSGGYITYHHGNHSAIPWLQLEINRSLYLPDHKKIPLIPDEPAKARLKEIRDKVYYAFQCLYNG